MKMIITAAVVGLALSGAQAFAHSNRSTSSMHRTDQAFVTDAARANLAEVELGKVAEARSSNREVKDFAKLMVADHQNALNQLNKVAKDCGITVPTALDPKDHALKSRLANLSGAAFDRMYMKAILTDHRSDVAEFRVEARTATNTEVKRYASDTLPTLKDHLKLAKEIDHSIVARSSRRGATTVS